ncbi:hypothetical protein [Legionella feeleii]|uniref:Uncharacterized protein n=1 Tax=Legionella feeleii TaxID=453 RepID=A0A378IUD2_9GAMM|nr:hypothetical protein [Legionella feeleii]STX38817.1 Uncharacterised protein [Legionella feeleii]
MALADEIEGLKMSFRSVNILIRADQVMAFYSQVCLSNAFKINLTEINQPVDLINLSWVLAICSLNLLDFKNLALIALEKTIYNKLMGMLDEANYELKKKLKHKYVDEVDPLNISVTKRHTYILPPDVVTFLLLKESNFSKLCVHSGNKNDDKRLCDSLNQNDEQLRKNKHQIESPNYRPSTKSISKCEFIVKELEEIAMSFNEAINREILWNQLKHKCNDGNSRFKLGGGRSKQIIEIATGNSWDRERLNYHLDNVIKWHKENDPQFY